MACAILFVAVFVVMGLLVSAARLPHQSELSMQTAQTAQTLMDRLCLAADRQLENDPLDLDKLGIDLQGSYRGCQYRITQTKGTDALAGFAILTVDVENGERHRTQLQTVRRLLPTPPLSPPTRLRYPPDALYYDPKDPKIRIAKTILFAQDCKLCHSSSYVGSAIAESSEEEGLTVPGWQSRSIVANAAKNGMKTEAFIVARITYGSGGPDSPLGGNAPNGQPWEGRMAPHGATMTPEQIQVTAKYLMAIFRIPYNY